MEDFILIRSDRKSVQLELSRDGRVLVRAPRRMPECEIRRFVAAHGDWLEEKRAELKQRQAAPVERLSEQELRLLAQQAMAYIPGRVAHYAALLGVSYGRITIRNQRTKWGSCSSAGNLNFNCLLMLTPPEVIDSVVAHELCHRKEMNHSPRFYAALRRVCPDYDRWNRWLKQNGAAIMRRMTG